jgi:RsiW-degrading membrane proteinase PrsW (M82 family)
MQHALADDLETGVSDAAVKFKKLIKVGVAVAAVVIVVIGLMVTGFKFSQKDPGAIWYLAGTAAGGALFGVAAAML